MASRLEVSTCQISIVRQYCQMRMYLDTRTFTGRRLTTIDSASTQPWDSELHAPFFLKDSPGNILMICEERGVQVRFIDVNAYDKVGDYWRVRRREDEH